MEEKNHEDEIPEKLPDGDTANIASVSPHEELQTEKMEVHHHPQLEHKPKPWKEYILEYIMIFLAVTTGFFAESLREHIKETGKEKEFITSLKEDLAIDTARLQYVIPKNKEQFEKLDSLYTLVELAKEGKPFPINRLYYLTFRYAYGLIYFTADERTISQIKSTGGFALIKNRPCRDSITKYYLSNEKPILLDAQGLKEYTDDLGRLAQKIFDYKYAKTFWFDQGGANVFLTDTLHLSINNDKQLLLEYGNKVRSLMMMVNTLEGVEQEQLTKGKDVIASFNKEYHLQDK